MEISSEPHHELVTRSFHNDFRDEEEDDEENRFIISLDDIDMKDELLDEFEQTPSDPKSGENKFGQNKLNAPTVNSHKPPSLTENTNLTGASINHNNSGKNYVFLQVPQDVRSGPRESSGEDKIKYVSHSDFVKKRQPGPDQNVKDGLNKRISEHTASSGVVDLSLPCNGTHDGPPGNTTSQAILTQGSGPAVNNDHPLVKPTSESNCSCIMCYQGRGIIDSNHIPKAAKRRLEMPPTDNPIKAKKLSPNRASKKQVVASSLQTLINNKINSVVAKSASSSSSHPVPQIIPVTGSSLATPHLHHSVLQTPSLIRKPNNSPRYVCMVPASSKSSDIQLTVKTPQSSPLISTSGHMGNLHASLPSLTRKPDVPLTIAPTVSLSPVVLQMSSQANFSLTSQTQTIISTPTTKVNTAPTEKTQVVLVNKSSLDKQVADISSILKQATKVDLSNPGMVLVHFKPSSKTSVTSDSSKLSVSSSQSKHSGLPTKGITTSPSHPCMENALFGLVKTHLTSVSSSNVALHNTKLASSRSTQCDVSARQKNPFTSKPQWQYTLVNGTALSTPSNKNTGSVPLPPPPPLVPRPGCNDGERPRPKFSSSRAIINLDEQLTETMVLPLPKNDRYMYKPASNLNVDISKQDELLLSPNLFTFSSPYDLSPKKSSSSDVPSKKMATADDSVTSFHGPIHPLIPSLSSVTSANPIVKSPLTASLLSSSVTVTTQSPAVHHHNSVQMTSPSALSLAVAQCHSTKHQTQEVPVTSLGYRQTSCGQTLPKIRNISQSSPKSQAQCYSTVTTALSSQPSDSTPCSTSSSLQSSVSIMSGLKVKICLKDSQSENKETLCNNEEQKSSSKLNEAVGESSEHRHSCETLAEQNSTQLSSTAVSQTDSTSDKSETVTAETVEKSGSTETAEEMFKRFEDQAMQQVYNAQFGVGEIQRSLRPNRTTTVTTEFLYLQSRWGKDSKKKKTDEEKTKTNTDEPRSTENASVVNKNVKIKRKRSLSGEERQKQPEEKSIKLDINQYPKLLQDNSILNRKTIYTPNILAGHKVFVKFNVFSNSQSGKSFLVPFFNIGGSRTQFDVEDMEYINRAVVEFEKEEKSCARHLLYYSREGKKAAFLRKECGLKSSELSSKSYKKCSFILEGYKREQPKQTLQPVEEWKVDSQVQIEIDRAEQDSESDAPKTSEENQKNSEEAKTSSPLKNLLSQSVKWNVTNSESTSSILSDDSVQGKMQPCDENLTPGSVCDSPSVKTLNSTKDISNKCVSYRHSVNILKRQQRANKISSASSPDSSCLSPVIGHTEKLDLVMSGGLQDNVSLSSSCETLLEQTPTICKDHDLTRESLPTEQLNCKLSPQILPQIKTEVEDDGYEQALTGKPAEELAPTNLSEINIKSEPIDDYTESLARSMNISLQSDARSILGTVLPGQDKEHNKGLEAKLDSPSVVKAPPFASANHVEPVEDQNIKESGTEGVIKKLDKQSKVTEEKLSPPSDVLNSVSKETLDTSSTVTDEGSPFHESENMEDSSSYLESSPLYESSDVTSSSDVETSDDEEDDELSTVTTVSCIEGPASSSSSLMSENKHGFPVNSKITSLVESLKQRLTESRATFPPVIPAGNIRLRKKRKKKKKKKRNASDPKCMKDSLSSSNFNSILTPAIPIHSTASKRISDQLPSNSSLTISDPASECEISQGQPTVDIKQELPLPSTSSLNSLSILPSSSTSSVTQGNEKAKSSLSMVSAIETNQDKNNKNSIVGDLSPSCSADSLTKCVSVVPAGSDHLTVKKSNPCDKIPSINKNNHSLPESEKHNPSRVDSTLLVRDSSDWDKSLKKGIESFNLSSPTISHSNVTKSSLQDVSLPNSIGNSEAKEGGGREDEVQVKREPESDPLLHFGEPEIDVGTEEVLNAGPIKQERPVPLGKFLSSPPVPSFGRKYIKDFTREHDLMVPLVTVSRLKSKPNSGGQSRTSKAKGSSTKNSPESKESKTNRKAARKETSDVSMLENTTPEVNVKPSVASLLCEKLAIEVEPVIPKIKTVRGVSSLSQANIYPAREQHTPLPGHKSFNRPTLNAIFGVDNVSLPPHAANVPEDGDEGDNEEPTDIHPEKQGKRQVAMKRTRSQKIGYRSNKRLQPPTKQLKRKSKTPNAILGVEKASVPPCVPSIPEDEDKGVREEPRDITPVKQGRRQVAMKGTRSRKIASNSSKRAQPPMKQLKTKSSTQSSPQKERTRALLRKGSQIKSKLKSSTSSGVRVIQRRKFNLQSCFRTWRQLSHEESKNKQKPRPILQHINVTPCSVVLQRLEDMKLDSNGQPLDKDSKVGMSDTTKISSDTTDMTEFDNDTKVKEIRCANLKKRKKRPIMTITKRRGTTREKKKDIVDYYTTMLESLRKKAQLLEDEALKNELKLKNTKEMTSSNVENDPANEVSIKTECHVGNEHCMEDTEISSEQSQNVEAGTEMETSVTQDSNSKTELNETKNTDSDILDFHSDKEAESSPCLEKGSKSTLCLNMGSHSTPYLDKEAESSPCLDKGSNSTSLLDKEAESSPCLNKGSTSSPCPDKGSNSSQCIDEGAESTPCLDKGTYSSQCIDKGAESSPCLDKGTNSSQCLDKGSNFSQCIDKVAESSPCLDKESNSSPCLDKGFNSSPCHYGTDKQEVQPVQKEISLIGAVDTNTNDSKPLKLNQQLPIIQEKEELKKNSSVELVSGVSTDQQTMALERKNVERLVKSQDIKLCDDSKELLSLSTADTDNNKFTSSGGTVSLPETQNNKDCKDSEKPMDVSNCISQKPDPLEGNELKSPTCDSDNVKRTESELSTSPPLASGLSYDNKNSHSPGADNGYLSDSSEVGCLVIDYDTESELEHKTATDTKVSCVDADKKSANTTPIPSDISDLMSDSNFRTKDIVLGFENDLGADTVISTLSQADMDDMFLLEEDGDESSIGMIAEEEVEKLLGLDVTADGRTDQSACSNQKNDSVKIPAIAVPPPTPPPSSSQSSENLQNKKLHWTPIVEPEAKLTNGSSGDSKNTDNEQVGQLCSPANDMDDSSSFSTPPSHLQVPVKKVHISPSWNRLLGSEALKEMEKSAEETIPSSSQPSHVQHENRAPASKGKLKLKFCAGALSKALKLSAEMKRVFSDGLAPGMSTDPQTTVSEKKNVGFQKAHVNKVHEDSKETPNVSNVDSKIDKFIPCVETKRGDQLRKGKMLEIPKMKGQEKVQQPVKICLTGLNSSVMTDCQDGGLGMQGKRETRTLVRCGENSAPKRIPNKDKASHVGPPGGSGEVEISVSVPSLSVVSTNTVSKDGAPVCDQTLKPASVSQAPSQVPSSEANSQPKSLTPSAKGIDLISMLKLKLNPLLSSNKIKLPDSSNPKSKHTASKTSTSKEDMCINKISTSEKPKKKHSQEGGKSGTNSEVPLSISTSCLSSSTKESSHHNSAKSSIKTVPLDKLGTTSEPSQMTSKLSNILKNIQKPVAMPKHLSAASSSKDQHSFELGMKKRLRSSPRQPQSQNHGEADKRSNSSASASVSAEDNKINLKKGEEEKVERSFFDCLSDVIPAASWEES